MSAHQIQLNVPLSFKQVVEIVKQLSLKEKQQLNKVLQTELSFDDIVIPDEHKQIVRQRIKEYESKSDNYLSWNDIELKMAARK